MSTVTILAAKLFHHNNLELQLEFDKFMGMYHINILHKSSQKNYSLFGIFHTEESAKLKFESIVL